MALDPTHLTSAYDNVDRTSYPTASITPTANRWLVIDVAHSKAASPTAAPTITGLSLTWVQEVTQTNTTDIRRGTRVYAWTGASPGTGALTIDFGGVTQTGCAWIVYELGADADTTDPFVQSDGATATTGTSVSVTLAAYGSADNRPLVVAWHSANQVSAQEAGYTEIADVNGATPPMAWASAFHPTTTDTTPSYSWTTSSDNFAIASEIKAVAAGVSLVIQDGAHAHSAESQSFTQVHNLTVAEASHGHAADQQALTQVHELAVQESAHTQAADSPSLTQVHNLITADGLHAHSADNVTVAPEGELEVAGGTHGHTADTLALTQVHQLVIQDASHGHTAESLALGQVHVLGIADAAHAHGTDAIVLGQLHVISVADGTHAHTADNVAISGFAPVARRTGTATPRRELVGVSRRQTVATPRRS